MQRSTAPRDRRSHRPTAWGLLLLAGGCAEGPPPPEIAEYLSELPAWTEFSPPLSPQEPMPLPDAEEVQSEDVVAAVAGVDEDGNEIIENVTYDCVEVPYSMTDDPGQFVISDPNRDVLYPGAFVQGRTHRDAISIGDVLPLVVSKRAALRVSIPDLSNPDSENFRQVAPNQAEVAEAIGNMVGNATRDDLNTPSSISFEMQSFYSEEQFALSAGMSGRYLGFSASASGSVENNASTTTVAVQFTQKMYTAVVEAPGSGPEAFFADDFTAEDLQALVDSGRFGPDNLPIYVSSVVYGRMMTFALTSTASESEIRAALQASYNTIAGGVSGNISTEQASLLEEASIIFTTLGGSDTDALAVIRSGDWSSYFSNKAALSTAVPLSYTFKNLGDNSIASVSETTEYTVKTCQPREETPGIFQPVPPQDFALELGEIAEIIVADGNGDGLDDLIFNHRGAANRVAVLHASQSGNFVRQAPEEVPHDPLNVNWNNYALRAGDVDGDGDADLVWNHNGGDCGEVVDCGGNVFYVGLAQGAAGNVGARFEFLAPQYEDNPQAGASRRFYLADINDDGLADPLLNPGRGIAAAADTEFAVRAALSVGDGEIRMSSWSDLLDVGVAWNVESDNVMGDFVTDFDGDGQADLVWNRLVGDPDALANVVATATARASLGDVPPLEAPLSYVFEPGAPLTLPPLDEGDSWQNYRVLAGDLNADAATDLVWVAASQGEIKTHAVRGGPSGLQLAERSSFALDPEAPPADPEARLVDVGGSDGADLVLNQREGSVNRVFVALSLGDGTFDYSPTAQEIQGDEAWSQYTMFTGNFGGSPKTDLAWVSRTQSTRVYVMIAK